MGETNLDPLNNVCDILTLKQELLPLHPHTNHILALHVVTREPAFRALERIHTYEISLVGLWNVGAIRLVVQIRIRVGMGEGVRGVLRFKR